MIRYAIDDTELRARIDVHKPGWLARAAERTETFIANDKYDESSSIWSEIKAVYMALQSNKCVFCERQFENAEFGRIEHDLEHFRPKSSVKSWPRPDDRLSYDFDTGSDRDGYYWLAYDIQNYAASCKTCNSTLKSNCFPIASSAGSAPQRPTQLGGEKAFLSYPIGTFDTDPEALVTFRATIAVPASRDRDAARRGQVIIDFFRLNDREILHRQRAQMIVQLGNALADFDGETAINRQIVELVQANNMPHAACSRAYARLWRTEEVYAREVLRACKRLAVGIRPNGIA